MGLLRVTVSAAVVVCALLFGGAAAGAPDPSYGPALTATSTMPWAVTVDGQGRALVAGFNGSAGFVERFTLSGHPDVTFGAGGVVAFPVQIPSVGVDPQNRVLVGGTVAGALTIWRLAENGTLDATYGSNG